MSAPLTHSSPKSVTCAAPSPPPVGWMFTTTPPASSPSQTGASASSVSDMPPGRKVGTEIPTNPSRPSTRSSSANDSATCGKGSAA